MTETPAKSSEPHIYLFGRCKRCGAALIWTPSVIQCPRCRDKAIAKQQAKLLRDLGGSG